MEERSRGLRLSRHAYDMAPGIDLQKLSNDTARHIGTEKSHGIADLVNADVCSAVSAHDQNR